MDTESTATAKGAAIIRADRTAADLAMREASDAERRAGTVPAAVRRLAPSMCRLRACALRRFAEWLDGPGKGSPDLHSAARLAGATAIGWRSADKISRAAAWDGTPKGLRDAALVAVASDLCAPRVGSRRASGPRLGRVQRWQSHRRCLAAQNPPAPGRGYLGASTVRRLNTWRAAAGIESGPLLPWMHRWGRVRDVAMQRRAVADVIRQRAATVGLRATGHSLRVGAAVSMASRGASLVAMQQGGGPRPTWPPTTPPSIRPQGSSRHPAPR